MTIPAHAKSNPHTNRLINEKSPYLLQHAHNPVDWYPWGEEAFAQAAKQDKPIFLSVGYSTCHWCHVMEEESFVNAEIAQVLNEHFIAIKVDREERPDIDKIYMSYVQATTGSGGWPMTVVMSPERIPFFGGTYFPPEDRWGRPGLKKLLLHLAEIWREKKDEIGKDGPKITRYLENTSQSKRGEANADILEKVAEHSRSSFDTYNGGFGSAPKFPTAHRLSLLMRYQAKHPDPQIKTIVETTLHKMADGGIYDHVGGGFHRYSVDAKWFVPHFEKMLYDQAILLKAYTEAYQVTHDPFYERIAREVIGYVLRDLRSKEGGFYSAEDADSRPPETPEGSDKREGAFYVWHAKEISQVVGSEDNEVFNYVFGVEPGGNVDQDPQNEFTEQNILARVHSSEDASARFKQTPAEIQARLTSGLKKLSGARQVRPRPHLDDKVLVDWNGLMIASLAFAARVFEDESYAQAAEQAADFILKTCMNDQGRLWHRYRDGEAAIPGQLDDYAFLVHGLITLYEATFNERWLEEAIRLTHMMDELFWDKAQLGYFMTAHDTGEFLITRPKEWYDGAIPSGNSFALLNAMQLASITTNRTYADRARETLTAYAGQFLANPTAYTQALMALDYALGPSYEMVIAGEADASDTQAMLQEIYRRFLPNKVLVLHKGGAAGHRLEKIAPFLKNQTALESKATIYVCRNHVCQRPLNELKDLKSTLDKLT